MVLFPPSPLARVIDGIPFVDPQAFRLRGEYRAQPCLEESARYGLPHVAIRPTPDRTRNRVRSAPSPEVLVHFRVLPPESLCRNRSCNDQRDYREYDDELVSAQSFETAARASDHALYARP